MRKPNFFILGAPKCGTTSLAAWLSTHPQIYMSRIKEPHYFNFDHGTRQIKTLEAYEALFKAAHPYHIAVGEASVRYLYSRCAVTGILNYTPEAKFIVLIRNPVEMAYSLHNQSVYNGFETELDFERAWHLQPQRTYGKSVPRGCPDPELLQYGKRCQLGSQLQALFSIVPRDRVLILRLDDLKKHPRSTYLKSLQFLGLAADRRSTFPAMNPSKERRFAQLATATQYINAKFAQLGVTNIRVGVTRWLASNAWRPQPRPPLSPEFQELLQHYFAPDVTLMETITALELSEWKRPHT